MQKLYQQYKKLLIMLAYQLTGSVSDAEDAVHDVFLKLHEVDPKCLTEPKAYLCKMVTNRCLDLLRSARKQREQYYGEWLPEPLQTAGYDSFEATLQRQLLSYAMLVLLEKLTPAERAVFVLREALQFDYSDIALLIGKRETNCRKLYSRARGKMGILPDERISAEEASEEWVRQFLQALEQGRVNKLISMLSHDVVLTSDGGGKVFSAIRPIRSPHRVVRFLLGLHRIATKTNTDYQIQAGEMNGQTAIVIHSNGKVDSVVLLHAEGNEIRNLYFVRNPDKLGRIPNRVANQS